MELVANCLASVLYKTQKYKMERMFHFSKHAPKTIPKVSFQKNKRDLKVRENQLRRTMKALLLLQKEEALSSFF